MIEQILTMNNFKFNGEYYLQIQGTAMGTRMAPSYANIFMGKLETQLLQYTTDRPSTWWRYIDDIFAIWSVGQERLQLFLQEINNFHPTIKFTSEWSKECISSLDTKVIIDDSDIYTDLYSKPTDTHPPVPVPKELPPKSLYKFHPIQPGPET